MGGREKEGGGERKRQREAGRQGEKVGERKGGEAGREREGGGEKKREREGDKERPGRAAS